MRHVHLFHLLTITLLLAGCANTPAPQPNAAAAPPTTLPTPAVPTTAPAPLAPTNQANVPTPAADPSVPTMFPTEKVNA